jgi:hypothetical protein
MDYSYWYFLVFIPLGYILVNNYSRDHNNKGGELGNIKSTSNYHRYFLYSQNQCKN